jgi:hypothetical protein
MRSKVAVLKLAGGVLPFGQLRAFAFSKIVRDVSDGTGDIPIVYDHLLDDIGSRMQRINGPLIRVYDTLSFNVDAGAPRKTGTVL